MSDASDSLSEEERSLFRPFTRESLATIEAQIAEDHARQKEFEKKRAEGEVSANKNHKEFHDFQILYYKYRATPKISKSLKMQFQLYSKPTIRNDETFTLPLDYVLIFLGYLSECCPPIFAHTRQ